MAVLPSVLQTISTLLSITYPVLQSDFTTRLNGTTFDFIIVGAGSAGATVAGRLSENKNVNVLLLESGGYPPFQSEIPTATGSLQLSPTDWFYKVTPQTAQAFLSYNNRQCNCPRGKVLGGTSTINGMVYVRGNPKDYDQWASLGNPKWNWSSVFPYFLKSEGNKIPWQKKDKMYHNSRGPLTVSEADYRTPSLDLFLNSGIENGYLYRDVNAKYQRGVMPNPFTMRDGARCSSYKAFLEPAINRTNLVIGTQSTVTKILFDADKRATEVVFSHLGVEYVVKANKEIILSAGVVGSPQILMLSGVGDPSHLQQFNISPVIDLLGVGQNLQDHVGNGALMWTVTNQSLLWNGQFGADIDNYNNWFLNRKGPLTSPLASEGVAFVNTSVDTADWPDVEILYASSSYAAGGLRTKNLLNLNDEIFKKYLQPFSNQRSFGIRPFYLRPKSRGWVRLQSSDPFQPPLINPNYLSHPEDLTKLIQATKLAFQFGNSSQFRENGATFNPNVIPGCEGISRFSDEYWNCTCRYFTIAGYHPVGTCKMGPASDPLAVVDEDLRLHKAKGLRVVDASAMPDIISGNTNAAVIMMTEKIAEDIQKTYKI